MKIKIAFLGLLLLAGLAGSASAFVIVTGREDSVGSAANYVSNCFNEYSFQGLSGMQIWMDLDSRVYSAPIVLCLELVHPNGAILNSATTESLFSLGDPGFTSVLTTSGTYKIRVSVDDGSCGNGAYSACQSPAGNTSAFYLLNVSTRKRASEGSASAAINQSVNTSK